MFVTNFDNQLINTIKEISSVTIFKDGHKISIDNKSKMFSTFYDKIVYKLSMSRILPALAVSIHDDIVKEMKKDMWIQINFDTTQEIDGLPFESLLFKLEKTAGLNLIRKYQGKYEGRCIYLWLNEEIEW